jgi:hypothetical protein
MNQHAAFDAVLRSDPCFFIWKSFQTVWPGTPYLPNWHVDAIVYQLMRVQAGDICRLLINLPPRSLKSLSVSVAYVAWLLGHDPTRRVIVVSYSNEFAAELHRQFRLIIDAPWYRALFPGMRPAKDSGAELVTTAGGSRYATSVGGTLTGRGADLIIVDDPLKADEAMSEPARRRVIDWYSGTLVSRLNDKEKRSDRRGHATLARGRSRRPSPWPGWLAASRLAGDRGRGHRHSDWIGQADHPPPGRPVACGAREQGCARPPQGRDRQLKVLRPIPAAAGADCRQSDPTALVPDL